MAGFNERVSAIPEGTEGRPDKMPQIVVIVDELADLMMVAPGDVENAICRPTQCPEGMHPLLHRLLSRFIVYGDAFIGRGLCRRLSGRYTGSVAVYLPVRRGNGPGA